MKTVFAKKNEVEKKWYVVDAKGMILGRLAVRIAVILRGKNKPIFTPNVDAGDYVIVLNAADVRLTGNKLKDKMYYRHSGYPGGIKTINAEQLLQRSPEKVIMLAVKGMLPKNRLGRALLKKLRVFKGATHNHIAQQPEPIDIKG
ncbi:MAG TPA: 50S ribosomal protein L13 [Thermodesulfovibrionia bacterium]|nr:50S ribosomal protein L13 [Thermodesulfovibrionia bacterium]